MRISLTSYIHIYLIFIIFVTYRTKAINQDQHESDDYLPPLSPPSSPLKPNVVVGKGKGKGKKSKERGNLLKKTVGILTLHLIHFFFTDERNITAATATPRTFQNPTSRDPTATRKKEKQASRIQVYQQFVMELKRKGIAQEILTEKRLIYNIFKFSFKKIYSIKLSLVSKTSSNPTPRSCPTLAHQKIWRKCQKLDTTKLWTTSKN